jgi:lipid II:glycine glycyltransferase (peptidoglycan interpeptide bridge formation enzyme)
MSKLSQTNWSKFLTNHPDGHLLQTAAWGELKSAFGWDAERLVVESEQGVIGAQILFRRLPLGLSFAYIPKGPVAQSAESWIKNPAQQDAFWREVDHLCQKRRAVFLRVEPDDLPGENRGEKWVLPNDFSASSLAIQPPRTIVVDISGDEEQILGRMKQKTRYNIRLAQRKEVEVQPSSDVGQFFKLMLTTGERDEFGVHSQEYYQRVYNLFHPHGACELLQAEFHGEPLAALFVFARGQRSWYLYGASSSLHRNLMPTYLLQWKAIQWARAAGCSQYDLWGVPDHEQETLENQFRDRSDGLWGIYRFKRGFGGQLCRSAGSWDRIYQPLFYRFYMRWMGGNRNEL